MRRALLAFALAAGGCGTKAATVSAPTPAEIADSGPVDAGAAAAPYALTVHEKVRITSDSKAPNFQKTSADVDLRDGPFARATLVVDLASTCFPFEKRAQPPAGHRWPEDCDAFDRNFDLHLDDKLELVHAITPFGGPLHLEVDITDVVNGLPGKHTIETRIATWGDGAGQVSGAKGGWTVSARIDLEPGPAPRRVLAVTPLLDVSVTAADGIAPLAFEAPVGTTAAKLEVRTTGHGGGSGGNACIGPAEEFCERTHTWTLDGAPLDTRRPWRTDCAKLCTSARYGGDAGFDYCKENPCGAIRSVKAPRANWCPGSVTPPFVWQDPRLAQPGKHTLGWRIDEVASGGSWAASATYFAYGD